MVWWPKPLITPDFFCLFSAPPRQQFCFPGGYPNQYLREPSRDSRKLDLMLLILTVVRGYTCNGVRRFCAFWTYAGPEWTKFPESVALCVSHPRRLGQGASSLDSCRVKHVWIHTDVVPAVQCLHPHRPCARWVQLRFGCDVDVELGRACGEDTLACWSHLMMHQSVLLSMHARSHLHAVLGSFYLMGWSPSFWTIGNKILTGHVNEEKGGQEKTTAGMSSERRGRLTGLGSLQYSSCGCAGVVRIRGRLPSGFIMR